MITTIARLLGAAVLALAATSSRQPGMHWLRPSRC